MSKMTTVTVEWVEEEGMTVGWYECVSDGASHLYTRFFPGFGMCDGERLLESLQAAPLDACQEEETSSAMRTILTVVGIGCVSAVSAMFALACPVAMLAIIIGGATVIISGEIIEWVEDEDTIEA